MNLKAIDIAIAEKVMGWQRGPISGRWIVPEAHPLSNAPTDVPPYSSDISDAWQVVEKLQESTYVTVLASPLTKQCRCVVGGDGSGLSADTAPLAICLAALQALAVEIPQ